VILEYLPKRTVREADWRLYRFGWNYFERKSFKLHDRRLHNPVKKYRKYQLFFEKLVTGTENIVNPGSTGTIC
jgi:hypothetical protein